MLSDLWHFQVNAIVSDRVCRQDSNCQWQFIIDSEHSDQMLSDCQWQQFFSECCIEQWSGNGENTCFDLLFVTYT